MKPKKSNSTRNDTRLELKRLIEDQRRDAKGVAVPAAVTDESLVTFDGAIRARHDALRELVAPAPDEVLTTVPEDDD